MSRPKPATERATILIVADADAQPRRAPRILGRLKTADAIEVTRDWVARYADEHPDFLAAHLMGGITRMSSDEEFPADSDLDLMLVIDGPTTTTDPIDELYRGVAIEAGLRGREEYETAEKVLANPEIADHIAQGAIVSDPRGLLSALQPAVARDFRMRRWVIARCDNEKLRFQTSFRAAADAGSPLESVVHMTFAAVGLGGLTAVAALVPPTHRKCLVVARVLLSQWGHPELYEQILAGLGIVEVSRASAQSYADRAAAAFDRALEVKKTPSLLDFKLRPHLRPYLIQGSQKMIDQGDYREAMPWIATAAALSAWALLNDAPAAEKSTYVRLIEDLVSDLGYGSEGARKNRFRLTAEASKSVFALTDEIVAGRTS